MKEDIIVVLEQFKYGNYTIDQAANELLDLYDARLSLFQKNRLDLLNWAKSELNQETNAKLSKTMTPYRTDKIIILRRVVDWVNNEG